MGLFELFLTAVGLSMDACAVSICKGLSVQRLRPRHSLITGLYFGGFQALMPVIGFLLGYRFESGIKSIDHWIGFFLLVIIGINMIREAGDCDCGSEMDDDFGFKTMLVMAIATSIDALAVGVSFAFLAVDIVSAALFIGITTFTLSAAGVYVGHFFGMRFKKGAEISGGVILIGIGLKILLEHLGLISF